MASPFGRGTRAVAFSLALGFALSLSLLAGCGARTGVAIDVDASVGMPPPPPPPANGCTSAVSGATPMDGYCSTRAHLAPYAAPQNPTQRWRVALPSTFQPLQLVVDGQGRTYVTVDPNSSDDAVIPREVVVVDAHGTIVGRHDFSPKSVGNLFIAQNGMLHATVDVAPRHLVEIDPHGHVTELGTLPMRSFRFAIASDGTFVSTTFGGDTPDHVQHIAPDGTLLWQWPPDDSICEGCISDVALTAGDDIVVGISPGAMGPTRVVRMGLDGTVAWSTMIEGIRVTGPAIAPDGSARIVTGVMDAAMTPTTIVTALAPDGSQMWQERLAESYLNSWDDTMVVGPDGATFVKTIDALVGLGPDGSMRFRKSLPGGLYYDAAIDTSGTLVMQFGPVHGLDAQTGDELWHVDGPNTNGMPYVASLALAPNGCFVGWTASGLFGACDP